MAYKYNFTINLCEALKWQKGGSPATECHQGSRVCGIRENIDLSSDNNSTITPIDIAGTYKMHTGRDIDAKFELLSESKSHSDSKREGLRATLNGGRFPFDDSKKGVNQRAIVEFVCDKERSGLEHDEKDNSPQEDGDKKNGDKKDDGKDDKDDKDDKEKNGDDKKEDKLRRRDEENNNECEDNDHSLRFCGYKLETEKKEVKVQTLRLQWRTKYACEDAPPVDGGSHWGFFGWFFIMYVFPPLNTNPR
jgi:hypothetical protein